MKTSSAVTAGRRGLEDSRIYKLALTGLFAALSYVVFTFLQIKITLPGGDATSIHLAMRSASWEPDIGRLLRRIRRGPGNDHRRFV